MLRCPPRAMSTARSVITPAGSRDQTAGPHPSGRRFTAARASVVLAALSLLLVVSILFSLTLGSTSVGMLDLISPSRAAGEAATILLGVRLPRILLAAAVGAGLSAAGV